MTYDLVVNGRVTQTGFVYLEDAKAEAERIKRYSPSAKVEVLPYYG